MSQRRTLVEQLASRGITRRGFMKFCAATASMMALPPGAATAIAENLGKRTRPSVIWLSFQECTGCTESLTRADAPSVETLIFDLISLDYHHTLQACAGHFAEHIRTEVIAKYPGEYLVLVDGSIPTRDGGIHSTIAGMTNLQILNETIAQAAAVVAVGTCAAFGGLPAAKPNPTGAKSVAELMDEGLIPRKPLINVSGCPPIPVVITGVLAHYLTFNDVPALDSLGRPKVFFGDSIHDRCYRRPFYDAGKFAKSFDDEGARKGWCLYELGCKGPTTHNACATTKWNGGTSFPIESGHGCLGCSEPDFWDAGSFYAPIAAPATDMDDAMTGALAVGALVGVVAGWQNRHVHDKAAREREPMTIDDIKDDKD